MSEIKTVVIWRLGL